MHISEGILGPAILVGGTVLTAGGVALGLRKLDSDRIPQVAVLTAGFFVASLIHIPLGPVSTHLVLNGFMGLLLGWAVFPALLVGLLLQAVLFQYGGLTTLGVNTFVMAFPAVLCAYLFRSAARSPRPLVSTLCAFLCGALAVLLSSLLVACALVLTGRPLLIPAQVFLAAQLPLMGIEGLVTALVVKFLKRVKPEMLEFLDAI